MDTDFQSKEFLESSLWNEGEKMVEILLDIFFKNEDLDGLDFLLDGLEHKGIITNHINFLIESELSKTSLFHFHPLSFFCLKFSQKKRG